MLSGWEIVRFRWGYQLKVMPLTCCIPPSGNPSGCAWTKLKWKFCSTCGVFFLRENDLYYDTSCNKYPREPAQKWGKGGKSDSWLAALCSRRFNWFDLCRRRPARKTLLSQGWKLKLGNIDEIQKDFTVGDDKGWNTAHPTDISNILVMKSQIWSSNVEHTMISYMLYL